MVHASNTMWRVKNQPSNSTSCSDNTLHLLNHVVGKFYWVWGCLLKGCLREVYFEMQNPLEGHSLKTSILNNWLYSSCLEKSFFVCPVLSSNTLANDKKVCKLNRTSWSLTCPDSKLKHKQTHKPGAWNLNEPFSSSAPEENRQDNLMRMLSYVILLLSVSVWGM